MASTATHDPAEHLLRDIEPQMEILRRYIHEDTIWDGTAVYSRMERFAPQPPLPAAEVEDPPPPVYSSMENPPPPVYSNMENTPTPVYLKDLLAGACVFLMLNAIARACNAPAGTFSERLDKTRKGLLLVS
ncbi:hypothetical protein JCM24511_06705 [Saitozyma sp. JCM 24511]|nr:hypothetical protein JCM24511_06705 [Saitozyma sp. JCM 24511]